MTDITPEMVEAACVTFSKNRAHGWEEALKRALTAALAVRESTHVWVPREPTLEMLGAWRRQKNAGTQVIPPYDATEIDMSDVAAYRAMLSAGGKRDE